MSQSPVNECQLKKKHTTILCNAEILQSKSYFNHKSVHRVLPEPRGPLITILIALSPTPTYTAHHEYGLMHHVVCLFIPQPVPIICNKYANVIMQVSHMSFLKYGKQHNEPSGMSASANNQAYSVQSISYLS